MLQDQMYILSKDSVSQELSTWIHIVEVKGYQRQDISQEFTCS